MRIVLLSFAFMVAFAVPSDGQTVEFSRDVLPILSDNCFQCHGPDANEGRKGDLRLDDEEDVKRERDGYHVIVPGDLNASALIKRIASGDPDDQMPPPELGRQLSQDQIATLTRWVEQGAPWGKHWAFERIERPKIETEDRHPIDVFVDRTLEKESITPNPTASRETLIRRLTLDLTGLPPTPNQTTAFLNDRKPGAWERLVDRTLGSTAYGERMAWDWLEAARYADSNGYQGDNDRTMWPWRDWVVKAFNENLSYDQFTIWQLAGDLLPDASHEQILATGFNRNHMINGEGGRIPEENRVDYVMDMAETMGTVWLGLTLNCCRCHDHKFDPLKQSEYYQFTAFFNQTPVHGGGGSAQTAPILEAPDSTQKEALPQAQQAWDRTLENLTKKHEKDPASFKAEDWDRLIEIFKDTDPSYATSLQEAKSAKQVLDRIRSAIPKVMVMRDQKELRKTYMLDTGLYDKRGVEVVSAVPEALPSLPAPEAANRLDLARWLVSREHPLTARVTVNRFWQMLFGIGLVKTAEDFGVQAEYPVQRELLDWLATEFMESGWDVKHLLLTIVTSETYQRSSTITSPAIHERDPDNRLLARGPRFRMPSWMIRDQALATAGLLNPTIGGNPVRPYQPEGVWAEATFGKNRYQMDKGTDVHRRSLYTFWRRIVGPTLFFDTAKRQVCEVKPLRTNTPMHALTTLNDTTFVEAARVLAANVLTETDDDGKRLHLIGERVLGRCLSTNEETILHRSLARALDAFAAEPKSASAFLAHGESKRDPTLPAEIHAAWAAVCLNVLNLDETLTKE